MKVNAQHYRMPQFQTLAYVLHMPCSAGYGEAWCKCPLCTYLFHHFFCANGCAPLFSNKLCSLDLFRQML